MRQAAVALLIASAACVALGQTPRVSVVILEESMCPDCKKFVLTELNETVHAAGLMDVMDLTVIPWGNAYTETSFCPSPTPGKYNADVRKCWNSKCAPTPAGSVPDECVNLTRKVCQHGVPECLGNRIGACVEFKAESDLAFAEFEMCFVGQHGGDLSYAESCAAKIGLDWDEMEECLEPGSVLGDSVETHNIVYTNRVGPHTGVPWCTVNGRVINSGLLSAVCGAYTGRKPKGCQGH